MAKKKVGDRNKSEDVDSKKDNSVGRKRGRMSENGKDQSHSGGSERVTRSRNADEKEKGKEPVTSNLTTNDEGAQKGGGNQKGRRVSGASDWILKPHNPRQGNRKTSEKAIGKRKLVVEEENPVIPAKRRKADSKMPSAEKGSYNLRARNAVPSFHRLRLSESGLSLVVGKSVKVYKSGSRDWVFGKITSHNHKEKLHKVVYANGESEDLDLEVQRFEVEVMPGEASALCTKHKPNEKLKSQKTKKKSSGVRSDDQTAGTEKSDEEQGTDGDTVISEFTKVSPQKKKVAKPVQKMEKNAGKKKTGDGASAAKSKPSQQAKKYGGGQATTEKGKNPPRKLRATTMM